MPGSWKITTSSGTSYNAATVTAGTYTTVAELLDNADWSNIEPTNGPRQLIAWLAVLEAVDSDDKDMQAHLVKVMQMPMAEVMRTLQVTTE